MKKIIWYEIASGKVVSCLSTLEGTEEYTRPAYDVDNEIKALAYAEKSIDETKTHLATYNANDDEIIYATENKSNTLAQLRSIRNARLNSSDWTMAADSPLDQETQNAWVTYRQSLRDLPENYSENDNIEDVVFPTPPT